MSKFDIENLYLGNIVKIENGKKVVIAEKERLFYNDITDKFIIPETEAWESIFEMLHILMRKKPKEEDIDLLVNKVNIGNIPYIPQGENIPYVDPETIINLSEKKRRKRS